MFLLDIAVKSEKRVNIKAKDNKKLKFKRVEFENAQYYGISKIKGEIIKSQLNESEFGEINLHNKTMSIIYGTGIGIIVTAFSA